MKNKKPELLKAMRVIYYHQDKKGKLHFYKWNKSFDDFDLPLGFKIDCIKIKKKEALL